MSILDFFRRKKEVRVPVLRVGEIAIGDLRSKLERNDHLGKAAVAANKARCAIKEQRYDEAWRLLHEQKEHYLRHAKRYGMTARQMICLDGSVHEDLSNILRLEGKHDDALVHILYCVISNTRPTKSQLKKVIAYFKRCRFADIRRESLDAFLNEPRDLPDFRSVQSRVKDWRGK